MVRIQVEFLSDPSREAAVFKVSRVPAVGEEIFYDEVVMTVRSSMQRMNPSSSDPVAIVRVTL